MIQPECQKHFDSLMRQFGWLLDEYGFSVVQVKNGYMDCCTFVLRSGDCLLFLIVERGTFGGIELALAPASMQAGVPKAKSRRYHVHDVIDYLRGWYLNWSQIEERSRLLKNLSKEEVRARYAAEYRKFWPQIMELFREDEFKQRQADLEEFLKRKKEDLHAQSMKAARRREAEWLPKWRESQQAKDKTSNKD